MIVEADQETYIKGEAPVTLYSGTLATCIGVGAIYKNKGYLAKESCDTLFFVDRLLEDLKGDVRNLEDVRLFVGGACLDFESNMLQECAESNRLTLALRRETMKKIIGAGFRQSIREVLWGTHDAAIELSLHLSTGTHHFKRLSIDDLSLASELGFLR